jgi:hypothetical protein
LPVTYVIKRKLLKITCCEASSPQDLKDIFVKALADPACPDKVAFLLDVSNSTSIAHRTAGEIFEFARFVVLHSKKLANRCAVLASSDIQYGLCRMGSAYIENYGINAEVFRNLDEALHWLGINGSVKDIQ